MVHLTKEQRLMSEQWWETEDSDEARAHAAFLRKYAPVEAAPLAVSAPRARRKAATRIAANDYELIGKFVAKALEPLQARIAALENSPFRFIGTWSEGMEVVAGNFVSYGGSMWHANEATKAKPGTGPEFTLAVKRGAEGRSAK
jgi:hypothetical protein